MPQIAEISLANLIKTGCRDLPTKVRMAHGLIKVFNSPTVHIDNIISKAKKKIGLIWRLSNHVPRFAVENIYTTYIRPQLEYCVVIYNYCTKETSTRLESCQRRAAIACTRAYRRTNTITLLEELGWDKLETRRTYLCHILMYKLTNALVPEYMT